MEDHLELSCSKTLKRMKAYVSSRLIRWDLEGIHCYNDALPSRKLLFPGRYIYGSLCASPMLPWSLVPFAG